MLIATRCKKDGEPVCLNDDVRDRHKWELLGTASHDRPTSDDLNAICEACDDWDPIHKKPESRIFYACDVVDTPICPHHEVILAFVESEDAYITRFDDLCRPCRLFHPPQGV